MRSRSFCHSSLAKPRRTRPPHRGLRHARHEKAFSCEILERAILRPGKADGEWDSKDTILEGEYPTVTVKSLRSLLVVPDGADVDEIAAILAREESGRNVLEGIRRTVIRRMGLRDQPILDRFQDSIFRQPLDKQLLLLGPPGTGKTTTLIRRLGQKLSAYLDDREQALLQAAGTQAAHPRSWLMFTPTELLKQYVKEAFARENVPASDQRIVTWTDYRRELARSRFSILRTAAGSGTFVMRDTLAIANSDAFAREKDWFADFFGWQAAEFWKPLGASADALASFADPKVASIGKRLQALLARRDPQSEGALFVAFAGLVDEIRAIADTTKKDSDGLIRKALNTAVRGSLGFLDELAREVAALKDEPDDGDEPDTDEEDDMPPATVGAAAAITAYERSVRAKARSETAKRSLGRNSRAGRILEWLGERIPPPTTGARSGPISRSRTPCVAFSTRWRAISTACQEDTASSADHGKPRGAGILQAGLLRPT